MKRFVPEWKKMYGLRLHFIFRSILSLGASILLFFALHTLFDSLVDSYSEKTDFFQTRIQLQGESLQKYISDHNLSSSDLASLVKWERRHPIGICLFWKPLWIFRHE